MPKGRRTDAFDGLEFLQRCKTTMLGAVSNDSLSGRHPNIGKGLEFLRGCRVQIDFLINTIAVDKIEAPLELGICFK